MWNDLPQDTTDRFILSFTKLLKVCIKVIWNNQLLLFGDTFDEHTDKFIFR